MSHVRRIFVEKKKGFDVEAKGLLHDLVKNLGVSGLENVRIINRYDIEGISDEEYLISRNVIFSEPPVDVAYDDRVEICEKDRAFAISYLPGQYDQRADSAASCLQILTAGDKPYVKTAKIIVLQGNISEEEFVKIKNYCINPVEAEETSFDKPETLNVNIPVAEDVKVLNGFINMNEEQLRDYSSQMGFAMAVEDLKFCQEYFKTEERRDPTVTEIKLIDTYWSDHCRHTTFLTEIEEVKFEDGEIMQPVKNAYEIYTNERRIVYEKDRPITLMDLATIAMKSFKKKGCLDDLEISDENNACSVVVKVEVEGEKQDWLLMFKNETHNHPTEIEPFGGAATCLGGAIRDPLSGRAFVYQAMRVTGSGDPTASIASTIPGKLPQRKITTGAAAGYSSYGNQIGLATGQVNEIYHPGYIAKRMEVGAVIAAAPLKNVKREKPLPGDIIILLGGRTGRDGCGGATGSSKEHTEESLINCGAEVQKGNPPTERKIQRLFRKEEVSRLIKKCNDFGAGGVSVAIGELAEGLIIELDKVSKKYEGLDGTELAISESQERMAVVVASEDVEKFIKLANEENLEANVVATVTQEKRMIMRWRDKEIVNIKREFLDTNGVKQVVKVTIGAPEIQKNYFVQKQQEVEGMSIKDAFSNILKDLNSCSQKGLVERFDSTIGAGTILMPFGGKHQRTPEEGMVAKIPVLDKNTSTGSVMTFGFNPYLNSWSPFHGSVFAVVESVAKAVALGADYRKIRLTLQEYFEKLGKDSLKWGKPMAALLGAFYAQQQIGIAAIGGKDSMSGTFNDINVPPTLVSFAVSTVDVGKVVSAAFKNENSVVGILEIEMDEFDLPNFDKLKTKYEFLNKIMGEGIVLAACSVRHGGIAEAVYKMSVGNEIGICLASNISKDMLFKPLYGSIVIEISKESVERLKSIGFKVIGNTIKEKMIKFGNEKLELADLIKVWEEPLEKVFPTRAEADIKTPANIVFNSESRIKSKVKYAKPRVFIPVFPGSNCEYDTSKAFTDAGATAEIFIVNNLTPVDVEQSMKNMAKVIDECQIIMIPGGFSGGDEPEGSGKFIATVFRNPYVKDAVGRLLNQRDGLMLGICNGFQALIKLGLLPYGEIMEIDENSPTLTFNSIGRHVSHMTKTKISSNKSPWLYNVQVGDVHCIPVSHGEGRFYAKKEIVEKLIKNGQIATQYVDFEGVPSNDIIHNPNGSLEAIEGIISPDGRILGKMGHSERKGQFVSMNVPGNQDQRIFESGVKYFA